jgi:thiol:disulfide interchange protein DsbD
MPSAHIASQARHSIHRLMLFLVVLAGSFSLPLSLSAQSLPGGTSSLLSPPRFLDVDEAFRFYTSFPESGVLVVHWQIAPGYYLYRDKFSFTLNGASPIILTADLPEAVDHHDEFFGDVEVYYQEAAVRLKLPLEASAGGLQLLIEYQGCAEAGLCYTLQRREVSLEQ